MAKQVLEIEVPEGKKAIWKDGRIVFEDVDRIKTVDDAVQFLSDEKICEDILDSLSRLPENSFEWKIAAFRAVVAAITYNEQRHLTTGERWYPTIEFCKPGCLEKCFGSIIVGRIKSEEGELDVVGGCGNSGGDTGLGQFYPPDGNSLSWLPCSFQTVGSREAAMYISKQFGKLLFEISYGGVNCDWKWVK